MAEMEFEEIQRELSVADPLTKNLITRRAFLAAAAAGVSVSMMPDWLSNSAAWAAEPLGTNDGVIVVIQLGGGNDGLNTVVPTGVGTYYDRRGSLAISQTAALPLGTGVGLHPALAKLKGRYDQGKVAVVQGVGYQNPDLSHFASVAIWQAGWAGTSTARSGWLGRYLDGLGTDPLYGVNIGSSIPLHLQGARTAATTLPTSSGALFGASGDAVAQRMFNGIKSMGVASTGLGQFADQIAMTGRTSLGLSSTVSPCYTPSLPSGNLVKQMSLCARLINANLGVRVFGVSFGSFDTHSNQAWEHEQRLRELDNAIDTFYATLNAQFGGRVTLVTFSEFGRRVEANGSIGTDHGTAAPLFVIGEKVRGGLYGAQPSLTMLDPNGNLRPAVDFYSVYATVLDRWLNADSTQLLGKTVDKLDLFTAGPEGPTIPRSPSAPAPVTGPAPIVPPLPSDRPVSYPNSYRVVTLAGAVNSFGGADNRGNADWRNRIVTIASTPTQRGYWLASDNGGVFSFGDAPFHGSMSHVRLNKPIVGMASTPSGKGYWLLGADGGVFSFGDAPFYGSTGGMRLNQPVVGMAAVPKGGGYWFVARDGGVFSYGPNARFYGSTGSMRLNQPIVGMAPTPTGEGYWLVASDGGVFAFGDAQFYGSTGSIRLNQPVVGIAATPTGRGYRFVAADGGIFNFGDASFEGSLGGKPPSSPVVGITT